MIRAAWTSGRSGTTWPSSAETRYFRRTSAGTGSASTRRRLSPAFRQPNSGVASRSTSRIQSAVMVIAMVLPEVFWMSSIPMQERKSRMLCCQQASVWSARSRSVSGSRCASPASSGAGSAPW